MGGILDAGGHSEFTVVGDEVNVAQRLQTVSKTFEAADVFTRLSSSPPDVPWKHAADVEIPGRSLSLDLAYLPQAFDHHRIMAAG